MASTQILKRRIRSVRSTRQITKAMELVAASRMRRVQEAAKSSRAYAELAYAIMHRVAGTADLKSNPLFALNGKTKQRLYVVFTSDRGLAGAFNSNVLSTTIRAIQEDEKAGIKSSVIVFGRKGSHFFARISKVELVGAYEGVDDIPEPSVFAPVMETVFEGVKSGRFDAVEIIYTAFESTLNQKVKRLPLLPITLPEEAAKDGKVYEFEPSPEVVLERAANLYLDSQFMQAKVESAASEHAMRMMAMSNATRNAGDLIEDYTLELNATRQAAITQEIAEITGGAAAIA